MRFAFLMMIQNLPHAVWIKLLQSLIQKMASNSGRLLNTRIQLTALILLTTIKKSFPPEMMGGFTAIPLGTGKFFGISRKKTKNSRLSKHPLQNQCF